MSKRMLVRKLTSLVLLLLLLMGSVLLLPDSVPTAQLQYPAVILDAGHGGEDGGASGQGGVLEKELNLSMTFRIASLLREAGVEVILTRSDDRLLYTEEQNIKGRRKYYDLRNRVECAKMHPGAFFISIHMNSFPNEKYGGLQVWYGGAEESRQLAEAVRLSVISSVQPENTRKSKPGGDSIYLLRHAPGIAILIECGFLSNPEDLDMLTREDGQKELSFAIFCGIMNYLRQTE